MKYIRNKVKFTVTDKTGDDADDDVSTFDGYVEEETVVNHAATQEEDEAPRVVDLTDTTQGQQPNSAAEPGDTLHVTNANEVKGDDTTLVIEKPSRKTRLQEISWVKRTNRRLPSILGILYKV